MLWIGNGECRWGRKKRGLGKRRREEGWMRDRRKTWNGKEGEREGEERLAVDEMKEWDDEGKPHVGKRGRGMGR